MPMKNSVISYFPVCIIPLYFFFPDSSSFLRTIAIQASLTDSCRGKNASQILPQWSGSRYTPTYWTAQHWPLKGLTESIAYFLMNSIKNGIKSSSVIQTVFWFVVPSVKETHWNVTLAAEKLDLPQARRGSHRWIPSARRALPSWGGAEIFI